MLNDFGTFLFLAAGAVSLFAYLSVVHLVDTQAAERTARERFAVLRKLAEQPTESARLVLDLLREDEGRSQVLERKKEIKTQRDGMQVGAILIAFGLSVMLAFAIGVPRQRAWVVGLIPIFIGVVVVAFAALRGRNGSSRPLPSDN